MTKKEKEAIWVEFMFHLDMFNRAAAICRLMECINYYSPEKFGTIRSGIAQQMAVYHNNKTKFYYITRGE